LVIWFRL